MGLRKPKPRPSIVIASIVDWSFLSHRLTLAKGLLDAGYDVHVIAAESDKAEIIRGLGFHFHALPISRSGTAIKEEMRSVRMLAKLYRQIRPSVIVHSGVKLIVQGSLASRAVPKATVINLVTGLGFGLSEGAGKRLKLIIERALRFGIRRKRTVCVFQNRGAKETFEQDGYVKPEKSFLIRGSGVSTTDFPFVPEPEGRPIVMLPSRMLIDKGIREFAEAAKQLKPKFPEARFVLVGAPDFGNPAAVEESELETWVGEDRVEWWGHSTNMPESLAKANIVVLPSYHEGLPRVLLEAAATGRAIVASDIPGCREVAFEGQNALICKVKDVPALASAIEKLLADPALREKMGKAGRDLIVNELSDTVMVGQFLALLAKVGVPAPNGA